MELKPQAHCFKFPEEYFFYFLQHKKSISLLIIADGCLNMFISMVLDVDVVESLKAG